MLSVMLILFAVLLGTDVVIKKRVDEELNLGEERELRSSRFVIRKVYNRGFLLNLFDRYPAAVRGLSALAGAGVLIWDCLTFAKKRNYIRKVGMTLVSAGAASNLFDRLAMGRVVDYIGFRTDVRDESDKESKGKKFLGKITANLGDVYLVLGSVLVMAGEILGVLWPGRK